MQTYQYVSLYRLTEANEMAVTTENWSQKFEYDRYGNRTKKFRDGVEIQNNALSHPTIDPNTNRFTSNGYGYDKVGNLITDGNNATVGEYYYDGGEVRVDQLWS